MSNKNDMKQIFDDQVDYFTNPEAPDFPITRPIVYYQNWLDENVKPTPRFDHTNVEIIDGDSFDVVNQLQTTGKIDSTNTMVLNLASAKRPGGGVVTGSSAQEECLFRCSNYFLTANHFLYRLPNDASVLCRDVTVNRSFKEKYAILEKPFVTNCLAVSALCSPSLNNRGEYKSENDLNIMRRKIQQIFKVAQHQGYDNLVLGAIGCGVFRNPRHQVADLFFETIKEFNKCFKNVYFAILTFDGKDMDNFNTFKNNVELTAQSQL